jgi:hypothetical protein
VAAKKFVFQFDQSSPPSSNLMHGSWNLLVASRIKNYWKLSPNAKTTNPDSTASGYFHCPDFVFICILFSCFPRTTLPHVYLTDLNSSGMQNNSLTFGCDVVDSNLKAQSHLCYWGSVHDSFPRAKGMKRNRRICHNIWTNVTFPSVPFRDDSCDDWRETCEIECSGCVDLKSYT